MKRLEPRPALARAPAYERPERRPLGMRLDLNENTGGCSPAVVEALRRLTAKEIATYPSPEGTERALAAFFGVSPREVLLTNGGDEAIQLVCHAFVDPGDEVIVSEPAFSMYAACAAPAGATLVCVAPRSDFVLPLDAMLARITPRTRVIFVANPNNPTGVAVDAAVIRRLAEAAPRAAVVSDEAYFDFCGRTVIDRIREFPNLLALRTFAKGYGLAGLRIGCLVAHPETLEGMLPAKLPYNVGTPALVALEAALGDTAFVRRYADEVRAGRDRLMAALETYGVRYWPSEANFVLASFGPRAAALVRFLGDRDIHVRDRSGEPGCAGCVRISIGTAEQTDALLQVLQEFFEQC